MTDLPKPPAGGRIEKPTAVSEWTIAAMILLAFTLAAYLIFTLGSGRVLDQHAIFWLGVALVLFVVLVMLIALAFASPFLGTVKVTAGPAGVSAEIDGDGDNPPPAS